MPSSRVWSAHLIPVDRRVYVVKVLDLESAQQLVDTQLLQPLDRQRRGQVGDQHVGLGERLEDVRRHRLFALPFEGVLQQVLLDEGADVALPFAVRVVVVGRGQAGEPRRLGEGCGRGGEGGRHGGIGGGL